MYGFELWIAKHLGFIKEHDGIYEMTLKGVFYYHYYEKFYTLSYFDKMWGVMRKEAFPKQYITATYYDCTNEILCGLGQMYVADERFVKNMDKFKEGTTKLISEAIAIYCGK